MNIELFPSDNSLHDFVRDRKTEVRDEIYKISASELLEKSSEVLWQEVQTRFGIEELFLDFDHMKAVDHGNKKIEVTRDSRFMVWDDERPAFTQGSFYTFAIPYSGDKVLFDYHPGSFLNKPYVGEVGDSEILITLEDALLKEQDLKKYVISMKNYLLSSMRGVNGIISTYNKFLSEEVKSLVLKRKEEHGSRENALEAIGIKLELRDDPIPTITKSEHRVELTPKPHSAERSNQNYYLDMGQYEEILDICSNMAKVMELSPRAFETIGEEDLRYHFLVQLNGRFKGQATGETFNYHGKTDILVKVEGKNVFLAECKFWDGPKKFSDTIDQLINYVSWRDTKTAVILFNRKGNLTQVLKKIDTQAQKHANFVRQLDTCENETDFRYIFRNNIDEQKEFILSLLVFDVPFRE